MTMSKLPKDLEEEILSRVPVASLRAVRATCKRWNVFSKDHIIGNGGMSLFIGSLWIDKKVCSLSFNLHEEDDSVVPMINKVNIPDHINVEYFYRCDGLLLCVIEDNSSLLVWNPYLGQTRWIEVNDFDYMEDDTFALGYDNNNKNRNHKILRIFGGLQYEIFRFNSNSWSALDVKADWNLWCNQCGSVSLKGNTYFIVIGRIQYLRYGIQEDGVDEEDEGPNFLLCFDFTKESFGPRLLLPCNPHVDERVILSCVRDEQLALLYKSFNRSIEVWVTNKIDPNAVSWSKFLKLDITPLSGFPDYFYAHGFFIDEEKKVVVVFEFYQNKAHFIGDTRYLKSVNIGKASDHGHPLTFSSYVPSLVQLQITQPTGQKESSGSRET